jgi:hypothetical protein
MKRFIVLSSLLAMCFLSLNAQDDSRIFKRFKGDVSLGYAAPLSANSDGGVLFAMEPKFAVMDQLAIGLRIEAAVMAKFSGTDINGDVIVDKAKAAASYLATADYYFNNHYSFRPFIGGGAGLFGIAEVDEGTSNYDVPYSTKFGGMIRAGAEVKHFRFGVEFNIVPNTSFIDLNNVSTVSKNSYVGIKAGFCFGGGPR